MSLFNNAYSGIITNGLGGSACYSILTYQFGVFAVEIGPVPPPPNIGGGGPYPISNVRVPSSNHINWLTPRTNQWKYQPRQVKISVKLGDKNWTRDYVMSYGKAKAVVAVSKLASTLTKKFNIVVSKIKSKIQPNTSNNDK